MGLNDIYCQINPPLNHFSPLGVCYHHPKDYSFERLRIACPEFFFELLDERYASSTYQASFCGLRAGDLSAFLNSLSLPKTSENYGENALISLCSLANKGEEPKVVVTKGNDASWVDPLKHLIDAFGKKCN